MLVSHIHWNGFRAALRILKMNGGIKMQKRNIGLGSLSLFITVIGILWDFTLFGVCIGDNILNHLGLKAWSNYNKGIHYTFYSSIIFFIPAFLLGVKYKNNFGATVGRIISAIIGTFLILSTLFITA